jgi:hypothetical protein
VALPNPLNETQRRFAELCRLGGGRNGGPARTKVQEVLREGGRRLNHFGESEVAEAFKEYGEFNPWHICFAVGLSWGRIARFELEYIGAAVRLLKNWNDEDLKIARQYHYERGPEPIEQSLRGAHVLFSKVKLPDALPDTLSQYKTAEDRWLSPILSKDRPKYIGSWNATAMFMIGLFSKPALGKRLRTPEVMLPPGGPIFAGLSILYQAGVILDKPAGSELDDEAFEPGALYENNALMAELLKGLADWSLLDVHGGLYMLGTRHPHSDKWS